MSRLLEIFRHKDLEVEAAKAEKRLHVVRAEAEERGETRGFRSALTGAAKHPALIAEVKQASPSAGVIRAGLDSAQVAQAYKKAGAHALSVLTDERFFQGSVANLLAAREAVDLPILRKDFVFTEYQVWESRAMGADAILLIAALEELPDFSSDPLWELHALATELGLDVLVEVHTEEEFEAVLGWPKVPDLIGVNNRNLATFETDLAFSDAILPQLPEGVLGVSESALRTHDDILRVREKGAQAVLVGTTFCESPDIEGKVREVMGW